MQLGEMQVGSKGLIVKINPGDQVYRQRLMAMGLLPGTPFQIARVAPLGDPVEIIVRGFSLSLRKHEANILHVKEV